MSLENLEAIASVLLNDSLLDEEYFKALKKAYEDDNIKLVLIGLDPFPKNAIGIPFCKAEWKDLKKGTGFRVFSSLLDVDNFSAWPITPKNQAIELAKNGVIFLNSSYELLRDPNRKKGRQVFLDKGLAFNAMFLKKAQNILCLGVVSFNHVEDEFKLTKLKNFAYHPAARALQRADPKWKNFWDKGCLKHKFNL